MTSYIDRNSNPDVLRWDCTDVHQWLSNGGFHRYADLLANKHKMDGECLLLLNENDLKEEPIRMGLADVKWVWPKVEQIKKKFVTHFQNSGVLDGMAGINGRPTWMSPDMYQAELLMQIVADQRGERNHYPNCVEWTAHTVYDWLMNSGFHDDAHVFLTNEIDGPSLLLLDEEALRKEPYQMNLSKIKSFCLEIFLLKKMIKSKERVIPFKRQPRGEFMNVRFEVPNEFEMPLPISLPLNSNAPVERTNTDTRLTPHTADKEKAHSSDDKYNTLKNKKKR